ncbi:cobalamin B12-binding domain-containing protein [Nonomuraea maheshkhaliensis]|uniref:Cobalamin B12-binding domain-containing protein n=1 Tax=Nonomuraea maheshkhaliensis TaxID=419590 RepID=A0ABP4R6Y5_9ACTN
MKDDIEERAEALWAAATAGDEYAATGVAMAALDAGVPMETLLLDIVAAVQSRVGHEWAANRITVAQEHTTTAVNERVLTALADRTTERIADHTAGRTAGRGGAAGLGRVAVACIDGEWHAFPARLLTEVLRTRGWDVDYLGAQVSTPQLVAHLHRTNPDVVALSTSLAVRLPAAHMAITACRAAGMPVLAGGPAFGADGRYARLLGADAWAPDARAAADLLSAGPLPRRACSVQDDLPHLDGREYSHVTRSAPDLVRTVLDDLTRRLPETASRNEQQTEPRAEQWAAQQTEPQAEQWGAQPVEHRPAPGEGWRWFEQTAEEVAHIVDFLRAALYVEDPEILSSFVRWMADTHEARGVSPALLRSMLESLAARLTDFPHAVGALARAEAALRLPHHTEPPGA